MMRFSVSVEIFVWLCVADVLLIGASPSIARLTDRDITMDQPFSSFLDDIGLSGSAAEALVEKYNLNTSTPLDLACETAKQLLGSNTVDTTPLNQTLVEENW
jgi:hypothetical protein